MQMAPITDALRPIPRSMADPDHHDFAARLAGSPSTVGQTRLLTCER
jgi:hypothetical protein